MASFIPWLLKLTVLACFSGSVVLNFLLYAQARKYYLELNNTRLDPVGLNQYSHPPGDLPPEHLPDPEHVPIVFLGDSRAASWPAPDFEDDSPQSGQPNYVFLNRGINAQTSIQVLQRLDDHVLSLKPRVVVIQVGVNDLKTVALFPSRKAAIVANCQTHIRQIVEASRQLGATVIVSTIFPVGPVPLQRRPFWSKTIAIAINEVNHSITELADDHVMVLDAFTLLANEKGLMQTDYSLDELHLNQAAYAVLNQELERLLQELD